MDRRYAGQTREVSAKGVYFILDCPLDPGTAIAFTLTFPPIDKLNLLVRASGKLFRVDPRHERAFGIGVTIQRYVMPRGEISQQKFKLATLIGTF